MTERALIQKERGEFVSVNGYAAWAGFQTRGVPTEFFEWPELRDGRTPFDATSVVVGGVGTVLFALRRLGIDPPPLDYPAPLRPYLGRDLRPATLGEVRGLFMADDPAPWFVKPRERHKAFTGSVLSAFRDLIPTAGLPDELAVWVAGPVEFSSEWRYFVRRDEVIGTGHYSGDPFVHPDAATVRAAVADFRAGAPCAYAIDFGVTPEGRTLLVEVNDAHSLGHLGLRAVPYSRMLEERWAELVGEARPPSGRRPDRGS